MNRAEVVDLLIEIKENYPMFDAGAESIDRHMKYLWDIPFDIAMRNLEEHIRTERFPPTIADIRGRLGEQIEAKRMREEAESYFAQLELWQKNAAPPPPGLRDRIYAILHGDRG